VDPQDRDALRGELVSAAQVCPAVDCAAMPFPPPEPSTIIFGVGKTVKRCEESDEPIVVRKPGPKKSSGLIRGFYPPVHDAV
jgi:hypothetical protein